MADTTEETRTARRARHEAILAEVVQEETEVAKAEIAEKVGTLDVPLHLRIDRDLDEQLRQRAAAEHIPTSALVRRLLRWTVREHRPGGLTAAEVVDIAAVSHVKSSTAADRNAGLGEVGDAAGPDCPAPGARRAAPS